MGDMYSNNNDHDLLPYSSTSSLSSSSPPQDEISLFLRQILLRSHSTSAQNTSLTGLSPSLENAHTSHRSSLFQDAISAVDSSVGVRASDNVFLSSLGGSSVNIPSSSFGVSENEFDEYDCENEEGIEALVEQHQVKSVPSRSSSKRSRAAEVHNMSEKRRRNRINEKMKALQNLIPNSNKTDKASMLDEAIEYLKQLQLQVQMLSIRNGLSVHPMCFSEDLQPQQLCQMRSELNEEIRSLPSNMTTTTMPLTQQNPLQYDSKSTLPDKLNTQDQPLMPSPSYTINPRTSFSLQSSTLQPIRSFPLNITSEICSNEILQQKQLKASLSDTIPLGGFQVSQGFETGIIGKDQQASALRNHFNITSHFR